MAFVPPYTRSYDFAQVQQNNPAQPYIGAQHDVEFNNVAITLDGVLTNLDLIQRDDGFLTNGIVTLDSLDSGVYNLIGSWTPRGVWATLTNYVVGDLVTPAGTTSYVCAVANTSGASFAIDLALGYWQPVSGAGSGGTPATFSFSTNNVVLGRATSGAGVGEEIACTAAARSIMDDATVADIATTLGLGTASDPVFSDVTVDTLTVTGATASAFIYTDAAKKFTTSAAPTDGQLLVGRTGNVPLAAALTGTSNQVVVTNGAGSITLSLPQSVAAASSPAFAALSLTGLSTGSVVFVGGSSTLSQDATNFFWDDTNNRLGIGINAPTSPLHVVGDILAAKSSSGADVTGFISNTSNTASSNAVVNINVAGTSAGDPKTSWIVPGGQTWSAGVDNSASDAWVLSNSASLGTSNAISVAPTTLSVSFGNSIFTVGAGSFGGAVIFNNYLSGPIPRTVTAASDTLTDADTSIIANRAGTVTLTLPAAASYQGRFLHVKTIQAQTVVSNASDVVPQISATAGTAILAGTDGAWAMLQSDGANWIIMMSSAV